MYFTFFLAALARAMFFIRCFDLFLFIFLLILLFIFLYKREKKQNSRLVRFGRWVGHTQCIWSSLLLSAVLSDYFDIWTDFMYIIIIFALFIFILFCSVIVYTVAWLYCNTAIDSDYFFCSCCCCSKTSRRWDNAASYISIALNNFYGTIAVSVWIYTKLQSHNCRGKWIWSKCTFSYTHTYTKNKITAILENFHWCDWFNSAAYLMKFIQNHRKIM